MIQCHFYMAEIKKLLSIELLVAHQIRTNNTVSPIYAFSGCDFLYVSKGLMAPIGFYPIPCPSSWSILIVNILKEKRVMQVFSSILLKYNQNKICRHVHNEILNNPPYCHLVARGDERSRNSSCFNQSVKSLDSRSPNLRTTPRVAPTVWTRCCVFW